MTSKLQIQIDDSWAALIGGVGGLKFSTTADGGSESASWTMDLAVAFRHPALHGGALVHVCAGPHKVFRGVLTEPRVTDEGWEFYAEGIGTEGQDYLCFDGSGNTASEPDLVLDEAIERGLRWRRPTSISDEDFAPSGQTDALNYVSDLMDAFATSVSKRWRVDAEGDVGVHTDPTEPTWFLTPGAGAISLADEDYASDLYVRRRASASVFKTVHVFDEWASEKRRKEGKVDATKLGKISAAKATSIGNGILARGKARYAFQDAVEPSTFQVTTTGGRQAYLPFMRGGQMARLFGQLNEQGTPAMHVDFVMGRTEYDADTDSIRIAPTELAERRLGDVLQMVTKAQRSA